MSSNDDRLALSVVLRACAHAWHKCLSGCPYSLARAFLFARRSVASSSFLLRNVAMSQSGSQAVCRVNRRVNRTVSRSLRFVNQAQTSGRNRKRFAWRNSQKKSLSLRLSVALSLSPLSLSSSAVFSVRIGVLRHFVLVKVMRHASQTRQGQSRVVAGKGMQRGDKGWLNSLRVCRGWLEGLRGIAKQEVAVKRSFAADACAR